MVYRVFISYAKPDRHAAANIADLLQKNGYSAWWDNFLTAGEKFRDVIDRELKNSNAVVVVWSPQSISSRWVISEAEDAMMANKLVPLRTDNLDIQKIPKPFGTYHTSLIDDHDAVLSAIGRVTRSNAPLAPPRILVLQGDTGVRNVFAKALTRIGYEPTQVRGSVTSGSG